MVGERLSLGEYDLCGNVGMFGQSEMYRLCVVGAGGVCGEICFMNEKGSLSKYDVEEAWSALAVGQDWPCGSFSRS